MTSRRWGTLALTVLAIFICMVGCRGGSGLSPFFTFNSGPTPTGPRPGQVLAVKSVGSTGGTLTVSNTGTQFDGTTLVIPPGALSENTIISIATVIGAASPEAISLALGPDGLTLNTTVTLTVQYSDHFLIDNGIDDPSGIRATTRDSISGIIEPLEIVARDPTMRTVTAALHHFSFPDVHATATQPAGFVKVPLLQSPLLTLFPDLPDRVKSERTLIIVHGICSSAEDILTKCPNGLKSVIENSAVLRQQYKNVFVYQYPWGSGINGTSTEVNPENQPAQFLQTRLAKLSGPVPMIDIVAHSMGGLVSRYALERLDTQNQCRAAVRNLIMIATPNGGTESGSFLALVCAIKEVFLHFQARDDLLPSSDKVRDLHGTHFDDFPVRYVTIAGTEPGCIGSFPCTDVGTLGVPVISVQLNEPGSTDTHPDKYEHITFAGPTEETGSGPAGHSGLHCRSGDSRTRGAFAAIQSTADRTINARDNNVGSVLETLLRDSPPEPIATWRQLNTTNSPTARRSHAMASDSDRQRVVLFGGVLGPGQGLRDTWEFDGSNWRQETPALSPPLGGSLAYDSVRHRTVLYGGEFANNELLPFTWEFDGASWAKSNPATSPDYRAGQAMAFDSTHREVVLFGGQQRTANSTDETWVWDGVNWTHRQPPVSPESRFVHTMAYDASRGITVLFGGVHKPAIGTGDIHLLDDTWEWDGTAWTQKFPTRKPSARWFHAMTYNPVRKRVLLFAGSTSIGPQIAFNNETWEWDGTEWNQLTLTTSPSARYSHALAYDSVQGGVILFGGDLGNDQVTGDTWLLSP